MRACKDCRHVLVVGHSDSRRVYCGHPLSPRLLDNYYTGEPYSARRSIDIMRTFGDCKPEALLFEEIQNA